VFNGAVARVFWRSPRWQPVGNFAKLPRAEADGRLLRPRFASDRTSRKKLTTLLRRHRQTEEEPLDLVAAMASQELKLLLCLDALGRDAQPKSIGEIDHRAGHGDAARIMWQLMDEGLIDLEARNGQSTQVA
jgi:hypothetical protein